MVLGPQGPGRVGRRRFNVTERVAPPGGPFVVAGRCRLVARTCPWRHAVLRLSGCRDAATRRPAGAPSRAACDVSPADVREPWARAAGGVRWPRCRCASSGRATHRGRRRARRRSGWCTAADAPPRCQGAAVSGGRAVCEGAVGAHVTQRLTGSGVRGGPAPVAPARRVVCPPVARAGPTGPAVPARPRAARTPSGGRRSGAADRESERSWKRTYVPNLGARADGTGVRLRKATICRENGSRGLQQILQAGYDAGAARASRPCKWSSSARAFKAAITNATCSSKSAPS